MPDKELIIKLKETGIIDVIGDPISIQDTNFKIIYQNKRTKDMVGNKVGEYCYKAYHNKNNVCEGCHLAMSFRDGKIHKVERSRATENGTVYSENIASVLKDSNGEIIAGIEIIRDITNRKLAEKKLNESHQRLLTILDSINALIYVADMKSYELLFVNKHGQSVWGDIAGQICWKTIHKDQTSPCDFCSNKYLLGPDGQPKDIYTWEFQNTTNGHWYYIHDKAIRWVDERLVRLEIAIDITKRKKVEKALLESKEQLNIKAKEYEESNIALKVLLKQRENDKNELEEKILHNIKHLIMPHIEKLKKTRSRSDDVAYLNILENNLKEIISPFALKLSNNFLNLTPKEMQIADLVRNGKQDKEIAEFMNISIDTVKFHRKNIRKKLGIYGKRTNLRSHLLSMSK